MLVLIYHLEHSIKPTSSSICLADMCPIFGCRREKKSDVFYEGNGGVNRGVPGGSERDRDKIVYAEESSGGMFSRKKKAFSTLEKCTQTDLNTIVQQCQQISNR